MISYLQTSTPAKRPSELISAAKKESRRSPAGVHEEAEDEDEEVMLESRMEEGQSPAPCPAPSASTRGKQGTISCSTEER